MSHYVGLLFGYGLASSAVWVVLASRWGERLRGPLKKPTRPGLELAWAFGASVGVIAIGQLYTAGWRLPSGNALLDCLNQLCIFSPILVMAWWRGDPQQSLFAPMRSAGFSLFFGVTLATLTLILYALVRNLGLGSALAHPLRSDYIAYAVQVGLEDLTIAFLLSRLLHAVGATWTVIAVAALFQVGHIPAFLANGVSLSELWTLVLDTLLGLMILGAVLRSRNVLWLWPVHTVMDLMQFYPDT